MLKKEQPTAPSLPDPRYFVKNYAVRLEDNRYRSLDCYGCLSMPSRCLRGGKQIDMDYLALDVPVGL